MTKNPNPDINPEMLHAVEDHCSNAVKEFIKRALPESANDQNKHETMRDVSISVLGKQQLFGQLGVLESEMEEFGNATHHPLPLETMLLQDCLYTATSQVAMLLDLFHYNPKGTIVPGGGGHTMIEIDKKTGEKKEVDFNVLESMIMKLLLGEYMFNMHNVIPDPDFKDTLIKNILEEEGLDKTTLKKLDGELSPVLEEMREAGAEDFFPTGKELINALKAHVSGKQDILDKMLSTKLADTQDIDRDILAHKLAKLMEPLVEGFPHGDDND